MKTSTILPVSLAFVLSLACGGGGGGVVSAAAAPPAGRFAFVANTVDNTLSSYSVVPDTGQLRFNGYVGSKIGQVAPEEVVVHPTGRWVYTPNLGNAFNGPNISVYTIDPDTGQTSARTPAGTGAGPFDMVFGADGRFAYVAAAGSNSVWTYKVHPMTGELDLFTAPISGGLDATSISVHPNGRFAFVTYRGSRRVVTYDIDPSSGRLSLGPEPFVLATGHPELVVADPGGEGLFVCTSEPARVLQLRIDPQTGGLAGVATRPLGGRCSALAMHPGGRWLVLARSSGSLRVFGLHPATSSLFLAEDDVAVGVDPVDVSFDATSRFLYVTNAGSNDVTIFGMDSGSGHLTDLGSVRARSAPGALAMTPANTRARSYESRFLYVANKGSGTVTGYGVDSIGGLTELAGGGVLTGLSPHSLDVDPFGRFLYTVNVDSPSLSAFRIDPDSGQLTSSGPPFPYNGQPRAIAVGPSGRFAFVSNGVGSVEAFGIDPDSGELDYRGTTPSGGQAPEAIAVDPTGQFVYVSNQGSKNVTALRFDQGFLTGGSLQIVSRVTTYVGGAATSIRFAPDGRRAYVTVASYADQVLPMDIDPVDGGLVIGIPGPEDGEDPTSVDVHPDGRFAYAVMQGGTGEVRAFHVDKATGALMNPVVYRVGMQPIAVRIDPGGHFLYAINAQGHDVAGFKIDPSDGTLHPRGVVPTDTQPSALALTGVLR